MSKFFILGSSDDGGRSFEATYINIDAIATIDLKREGTTTTMLLHMLDGTSIEVNQTVAAKLVQVLGKDYSLQF